MKHTVHKEALMSQLRRDIEGVIGDNMRVERVGDGFELFPTKHDISPDLMARLRILVFRRNGTWPGCDPHTAPQELHATFYETEVHMHLLEDDGETADAERVRFAFALLRDWVRRRAEMIASNGVAT